MKSNGRASLIAVYVLACALGALAVGLLSCGERRDVKVEALGPTGGESYADACDDTTGSLQHWMGDLNATIGGRTLRQISIPGSHDAGMAWTAVNECRGLDVWACNTSTHGARVYNQLMCGSRYFDLRPMFVGDSGQIGSWKMGHFQPGTALGTLGCRGEALGPMLDDIASFFAENKTEIAILTFDSCYDLTVVNVDPNCRNSPVGTAMPCATTDIRSCTDDQKANYVNFVTSKLAGSLIRLNPGEKLYNLTVNDLLKKGNIIFRAKDAPGSVHRPDQGVFTSADLENYDKYSNTDQLDDMCGGDCSPDLLLCPTCRICPPVQCDAWGNYIHCWTPDCYDAHLVKGMVNDQIDKLNLPRDLVAGMCAEKPFLLSWTLTQRLGDQAMCFVSANSIIQLAKGARDRLDATLRSAVYDTNGKVPLEKLPNILLVDNFQSFATNAAIDLNKNLVDHLPVYTLCNQKCFDMSSDPAHCGACDKSCGASQICQNSACVTCVPSTYVNCNNRCVDLKATGSNWNCGRCNNVCSRCLNGECMDY